MWVIKFAVWVEVGPPTTSFTAKKGATETSRGQVSFCLWLLSFSVLGEDAAPPQPWETSAPHPPTSLLAKPPFLVLSGSWRGTRLSLGIVPLPRCHLLGLQCEGDHSCGQRGRGRGACVLVGAAVVQVGGHLGGEKGGLGTIACCWSRGQDCLELGNFNKCSLRVPSCFLGSTVDTLIKAPSPSPGKEGLDEPALYWEPVSAQARLLRQSRHGTYDLHFARGPAAVGGGEDGGAALAVPGPPAACQDAAHREGVDAVGVPVAVAVVVVDPAVAGGPDEDGAEATPSLAGREAEGDEQGVPVPVRSLRPAPSLLW